MSDSGASGRRESRKHEMRGRICDAAIALFSDKGCELTTVEEICERADVARKTFYNYYSCKQQLVHELSESLLFGETSNLIDLAIERFDGTGERLQFFFDRVVDNLETYGKLERALVLQTLQDAALEDAAAGRQLRLLNEEFLRLYRVGHRRGDVGASYTLEFLAEITVAVMNAFILNWVHQRDYPLAQRIQELMSLLQHISAAQAPA